MPVSIYIARIRSLQTDLVKLLIAEKKKWFYSPEARTDRWARLKKSCSGVFAVGDRNQSLEDEFWGTAHGRSLHYPFWLGLFRYTVGSGKHSHTYERDAVAFQLPRAVPQNFGLKPESFSSRLSNTFTKRDIETESASFNKTFRIIYTGDKAKTEVGIVRVLSPAAQTGLLDVQERMGELTVWFQEDTIVFSCKKFMPGATHTSLFRKLELDPRDEEQMSKAFDRLLLVVDEVVRYIS